ncbi:alveolar macrophage chemotactic factor-like [Aquarana catesbeiana]|uniref:alveolar macrophage chemotactic factor-like n=1 Tax=Aquarana catesbeiana TaxID=8400 RepID=UPI003CC974E9
MHLKSLVAACVLGFFVMTEVIEGLYVEPNMPIMRCNCRKLATTHINKNMIKKLEIIPKRSYCAKVEIIITLKNDNQVCIDPNARWFSALLPKLYQLAKQKQGKQENGQTTMQTP